MDLVKALAAALGAVLAVVGVQRLTRRGRLRARLAEDTALYRTLPDDSSAKHALLDYIDRSVHQLVALEGQEAKAQWEEIRWGLVFMIVPALAAAAVWSEDALQPYWLNLVAAATVAGPILAGAGIIVSEFQRAGAVRRAAVKFGGPAGHVDEPGVPDL